MAVQFKRPKVTGPQSTAEAVALGARSSADRQRKLEAEKAAAERATSAEDRRAAGEERAVAGEERDVQAFKTKQAEGASAEKRRGAAEKRTAATFKRTEAEAGEAHALLQKQQKVSGKKSYLEDSMLSEQIAIREKHGGQELPMLQEMHQDMSQGNGKRAALFLGEILKNRGQLEEGADIKDMATMKHPTQGMEIWLPVNAETGEPFDALDDADTEFDFLYYDPSKAPPQVTQDPARSFEKVAKGGSLYETTPGAEGVVSGAGGAGGVQFDPELTAKRVKAGVTAKKSTFSAKFEPEMQEELNWKTERANRLQQGQVEGYGAMNLDQSVVQVDSDWKMQKIVNKHKGQWKKTSPNMIKELEYLRDNYNDKGVREKFQEHYGVLPRFKGY